MIKKIIIILILSVLPLILTQTSSCSIFISNTNINSTNSTTCGQISSPCFTLSQGILSCGNQNSTNNMIFTFDQGVFEIQNSDCLNYFYNQSITLTAPSSNTTLDLSNVTTSFFTVSINPHSNNTDQYPTDKSTISILSLNIQNYYSSSSLFNIQASSNVAILITNSNFTNLGSLKSQKGTIFGNNLNNNYVNINCQNVQFSNIKSNLYSIIYSPIGSTSAYFSYCLFNNIQSVNGYNFGLIAKGNLQISNSNIQSSAVNYDSFITLYGISKIYLRHVFTNTTFQNMTCNNQQSLIYSIISTSQGDIQVNNCSFINNNITSLYPYQSQIILGKNNFISNKVAGPILYGDTSSILLTDSIFNGNTLNLPDGSIYSLLTMDSSNITIGNTGFQSNQGSLIAMNFSIISINGLSLNGNTDSKFIIGSCYDTSITISSEIKQFNSSSINCQSKCYVVSMDDLYTCNPKNTTSSGDKDTNNGGHKKDIIIGVSIAVGIVILLIIIYVIYRYYKHHHHHYQPINSHHHH